MQRATCNANSTEQQHCHPSEHPRTCRSTGDGPAALLEGGAGTGHGVAEADGGVHAAPLTNELAALAAERDAAAASCEAAEAAAEAERRRAADVAFEREQQRGRFVVGVSDGAAAPPTEPPAKKS